MARITDPAPEHPGTFGHDFNYSLWTAGTAVTLCNVPWNSDYRDIVNFKTQAAIDDYLINHSGPTIHLDGLTYARPGYPIRINLPFNDAYKFNYLRVRNAAQSAIGESGPRTFFYFIRDVRYIAPNTTELDIQLDVWQTFGRGITFGNCYVERSHLGIANENQFADNGRDYLTVPEGFDLGGEYEIRGNYQHVIGQAAHNAPDGGAPTFDVIVASTVSFENSGGTIDAPELNTAKGSTFEGLPNGAELYHFGSVDAFRNFVEGIADKPWISQGIISVHAVPHIPLERLNTTLVSIENGPNVNRLNNFHLPPEELTLKADWRESQRNLLPPRYRHLRKFLTYPYMVVELTTYSGTPLVLKPESMGGDDLKVVMLSHLAPPAPRIVFYPHRYNHGGIGSQTRNGRVFNDGAEFLDMVTGIFNLPTFSLVNNAYMSFMASNANTIPYQHSAADWSQQRALQGNELAFNQASEAMGLSQRLTEIGIAGATAQTDLANTTGGYRALQSAAGGLVTGAAAGPAGIASGALNAVNAGIGHAIDVNARNQGLAISSAQSRRTNSAQRSTAGYMRDTNKDFADFAARGDYEMAISAINAKVQDARMIQPTTSGQMGGDAFNLVQYQWAIHAKVKTLQGAAMNAIGEFWLRYGYRINRFANLVRLDVMTKFTYWKLSETYITSSTCPEAFKQAIRGIFEKGVTVWNDPDDIGNIDIADNQPLAGVTL